MEASLLSSLQRTSSIQGLLGQQLSSSQLSFSTSVAPPPLPGPERFCPAALLDNSGHRAGQRAGLAHCGGLHYEGHFSKWSFPNRKGFNGPAEVEAGPVLTVRTQVKALAWNLLPTAVCYQRYKGRGDLEKTICSSSNSAISSSGGWTVSFLFVPFWLF